jgi:hypothetical protein
MRHASTAARFVAISTLAVFALGCEPYRIEYHRRPEYYSKLVEGDLPNRVVLEDGTVIVYNAERDSGVQQEEKRPFMIREEMEDGTIVLRAALPQHVIANTLTCISNREYELLWDQMLSERTKMAYEAEGQGAEEFGAFFSKHREELAKTLNRMMRGLVSHDVVVEQAGNGVIVLRFWPQVAQQFKFRRVEIVHEGLGLKLLLIR